MKKTVILSILIVLSGYYCFGQGVKFGVYVQPQFAWLSSDTRNVNGEGMIMGIDGGLAVDKYFQKNYALQTGISLGSQGGKVSFEDQSLISVFDETDTLPAGTTVTYKLNYITVPIGLKLKSNEIGYFSYFAQLGFTNQFNIKARANSSDESLDKSDISDEINLYNVAYYFGAGAEYAISKDTSILLGVFYNNGFIDVTSNSNAKILSRILAIRVGVMF